MYQTSALLFLYSETSLHPGSGTGIGSVDQPIQREVYTQLPVIHNSGVKGAARHDMAEAQGIYELEERIKVLERTSEDERSEDEQREWEEKMCRLKPFEAVFGPNVGTGREHEHGGALGFSDARILLFPVKSFSGLFAWVTCPFVLSRLRRDLSKVVPSAAANASAPDSPPLPDVVASLDALLEMPMPEVDAAWAGASSPAQMGHGDSKGSIVLEGFTFSCSGDSRSPHVETVGRWLGSNALPSAPSHNHMRSRMADSIVVVADEVFRDFTRFSTEIVTRIRIDETGTVAESALWNEEHLPSDCLLYSLTPAMRSQQRNAEMGAGKVLRKFADHIDEYSLMQFGGGKSLSRGLCQVTLQNAETLLTEVAYETSGSPAEESNAPSSPDA